MVLLELVSGRRNFEVLHGKRFSIWAYEEFENGNMAGILDNRLKQKELNMEEVVRTIKVSFWCIQEQPSQRPVMGKVVQMLEGMIEIPNPPPPKVAAAIEGSVLSLAMSASPPSLDLSF